MTTAVIVDVDGTLCDVSSALHHIITPGQKKDFDAFHDAALDCPPTQYVLDWCRAAHAAGHELIVVTGRKERHRANTETWLYRHLGLTPFTGPWMRPDDDHRSDVEVKRMIHATLVGEYDYEIVAAIDDRPSIIRLWRSLGIPTSVVYRAEFLEEHAGDIVDPEPADLVGIARTFQAKRNVEFESGTRLASGDVKFVYEETTAAKAGSKGEISIPERFTLAVPIFAGGDPVELVAALRYSVTRDHGLQLGYRLLFVEDVVEAELAGISEHVATGLSEGITFVAGNSPDKVHPIA